MIYLTTRNLYKDNEFVLEEICIGDDDVTYIMRKSEQFIPYAYRIGLVELVESYEGQFHPTAGFAKIRQYNDDDPKALANYIRASIVKLNPNQEGFDKAVYNVIGSFGVPYEG